MEGFYDLNAGRTYKYSTCIQDVRIGTDYVYFPNSVFDVIKKLCSEDSNNRANKFTARIMIDPSGKIAISLSDKGFLVKDNFLQNKRAINDVVGSIGQGRFGYDSCCDNWAIFIKK